MNKPFEVKEVKTGRINAICFSLDSTRPEDYYDSLAKALSRLKIDGEVLLDLLACNGQTSRRFFTVQFDGKRFALATMKVASQDALTPSTLDICSSFYSKNNKSLSNSVLSTPAIKKLRMEPSSAVLI
jgi:Antitoxin to bacterial toxin RNase LS or RnlA